MRFLFFEIKRVLVYNSTLFKLTDLFILYYFVQNVYMPTKKYLRKKAKQLCIMGEIVIESHSFLKILTEP